MRGLLASPLGFLIGLALGTLGGGGSILAVPVLVYVAGQAPAAATTTSLLVVGTVALVGTARHARAGRVRGAAGAVVGLTGIGGSLAGSAVNRQIHGDVLLLGFGLLLLVAAWRMVAGSPGCAPVGEDAAKDTVGGRDPGGARSTSVAEVGLLQRHGVDAGTALRVAAVGTAVGFLTGLFGVGGGFVIVPALTLLLRVPMPQAIGTSLLVITINAATALAVRFGTTGVEWSVAIPFTVAALAGVLSGNRLADRVQAASLARWFAGLLVALSIAITVSALATLT